MYKILNVNLASIKNMKRVFANFFIFEQGDPYHQPTYVENHNPSKP